MQPVTPRSKSMNFYINVIALVFIGLNVNNITVSLNPEEVVSEVLAKNLEYIITILVPSLFGIIFKVWSNVKAKTFSFKAMLRSPNFITQALTVLAAIFHIIGILIPEDGPQALSDAIFSGSIAAIILAGVAYLINPLIHFLKDLFNRTPDEFTTE